MQDARPVASGLPEPADPLKAPPPPAGRPSIGSHPGLRGAIALATLWILAWAVFYGLAPGAQLGGVPVLTWCHVAIGVLSVVVSLAVIPRLEAWERGGSDEGR